MPKTYSGVPGDLKCECTDTGCAVHDGMNLCDCLAVAILYRVDMDDYTGTAMCDDCATDAMMSGLFTEDLDELLSEDEDYS
jgi:hypothetical protein